MQRMTLEERFWSHVDQSGGNDACWNWQQSHDNRGYGRFKIILDGTLMRLTHRIAYRLAKGSVDGMCVCHRCDNKSCCNPKHLFLGTVADNNADKSAKGRATRGERSANAKLNDQLVRQIRQLHAEGNRRIEISRRLSINPGTVGNVINRRRWAHVI